MPAKDAAPKPAPAKRAKPAVLPSADHPPYLQMIKEAITALKDRTGSSQPAIAKFIEDKYKGGLPANFKKVLSMQLKRFAKSEKLVKVKNSFKVAPAEKAIKKPSAVSTSKPKVKKAVAAKVSSSKTTKTAGEKRKKPTSKAAGIDAKGKVKSKRLSQVVTPKGMKKAKPVTPKKVPKSIKAGSAKKPAVKRAKKA